MHAYLCICLLSPFGMLEVIFVALVSSISSLWLRRAAAAVRALTASR